jgi:hypothetical protein
MNDIYIYDIEVLADRYEEEQAILLEISNLEKKEENPCLYQELFVL